jgi:hypothetical protein
MKALALEYIVQWIILLTVAMIVISMIIYFSGDIKRFLWKQTQETKVEPRDIKKEKPFSSGEILTYVFSCWEKIGEKCGGEAVCFYLFGNFTSVDKNWVLLQFLQRYPEGKPKIDLNNFDTSKDYAKVRFRELDCAVVVEN